MCVPWAIQLFGALAILLAYSRTELLIVIKVVVKLQSGNLRPPCCVY